MKSFTDSAKRTWLLEINVSQIKKCKALLGIDLYGLVADGAEKLGQLLGNPCQLVDTLFVLCSCQCAELALSDEDFGRSFSGDSLAQASEAFLEELIDFFPDAQGRAALRKLISKGRQLGSMMLTETEQQIDRIDLVSVLKTLKISSGELPAGSASIPEREHSVSS